MQPYWTDGERTIYHGDCLEILPLLGSQTVSLVIADPPYGCPPPVTKWSPGSGRDIIRHIGDVSWDTAKWDWLERAARVLTGQGQLLCFCRLEDIGVVREAIAEAGLPGRGTLVWQKTNPVPKGKCKVYESAIEAICWGARHGYYWLRADDAPDRWNVIQCAHESNPSECFHPSQKPVRVIERLVRAHCPPGGAVLDPFMGSGTTLVVAKKLGLRGIGIELNDSEDEPYCRIARRRIEAAEGLEPTLFDATAAGKGAGAPGGGGLSARCSVLTPEVEEVAAG
jgi:DNA modification methylase